MNKLLENIKDYLNRNPKRTYFIGMSIIIISLTGSIIKSIWFPPKYEILPPKPPSFKEEKKHEVVERKYNEQTTQMGFIAKRLEEYAKKQQKEPLNHNDSVSIKNLLQQYKKLKR